MPNIYTDVAKKAAPPPPPSDVITVANSGKPPAPAINTNTSASGLLDQVTLDNILKTPGVDPYALGLTKEQLQQVLNARLAWEFLPLSFVYLVVTDTRAAYRAPDLSPSELRVVLKATYTWRP